MTRDTGLLDAKLTPTQVDLVFARVKVKTERRIKYNEFKLAIEELARVKYGADDAEGPVRLADAIITAGGPLLDNVHLPKASGVFDKLTDVRSFTGTHKERFDGEGRGRGKEGRVDPSVETSTLEGILRPEHKGGTLLASAQADRKREMDASMFSPARQLSMSAAGGAGGMPGSARKSRDLGGSSASSSASSAAPVDGPHSSSAAFSGRASAMANMLTSPSPAAGGTRAGAGGSSASRRPGSAAPERNAPRVVIESLELEAIYRAYCAFGTTVKLVEELDSARFAKLCRESGVIDGKGQGVTMAAVDLAFSKVKQRGKRGINYDEFQQALAILAPQRYPDTPMVEGLQALVERIIASGGPAVSGVALPAVSADQVFGRLTDASQYTGMYRQRFDPRTGEGLGLGQ